MTDPSKARAQNEPGRYLSSLLSQPLTGSELHIWRASLNRPAEELSHCYSILSVDERARAERFYFERDHNRYVSGRAILRTLLSSYLELTPSEIAITYGPHGKPAVQNKFRNQTLQFNLAHSNDWALFIFAWDRAVGIDLEHIRPLQDANDFAERFFSTRESALINSLSGEQKWHVFFRLWTCKEAFLKANGSGLMAPLDQVEISFDAGGSANLLSIGEDLDQASKWRLKTFTPIADYQAAIAVEGRAERMLIQVYDSVFD